MEIKKPGGAAGEVLAQGMSEGRQAKADTAEKKRRASEMRTQGRTGCKLDRVNLSITPENFEYIKIRAAEYGTTYSKTINEEITKAREDAEANDPYYMELRELRREAKK